MPSFILFNFLTRRSPRFSLNKIVNDTLSALCKIQQSEVAGKMRCQFSPLKTHFNLFFDQKHHKHLDKSINDLKKKKQKKTQKSKINMSPETFTRSNLSFRTSRRGKKHLD
jgi:hypothetical protein